MTKHKKLSRINEQGQEERNCNACGLWFLKEDMPHYTDSKTGKVSYRLICKKCKNFQISLMRTNDYERVKRWRKENPDKALAQSRRNDSYEAKKRRKFEKNLSK